MADTTIVLYASPDHLNTISLLAKFISKHHPKIPITIITTAAATTTTSTPSITYHHLPTAAAPPTTTNPVELFFEIPRLNNPNLHKALQQISIKSTIKAFIIDFFCYAAFEVSTSLNIPTYFDFSTGAYGLCAMLYTPALHDAVSGNIKDLNDFIHVPGCPPIHSSDFPQGLFYRESNTYKHFLESSKIMAKARGIIVNAFDAIAVRAKEALSNGLCVPNAPTPPVYFLGPLIEEKCSQNDAVQHECIKWLDSQPSRSVIFLCFGRRGLFSGEQLKEIAIGLENSGYRFLWSVRSPPGKRTLASNEEPDLDALLPEGFLERTKDRGFVIKSWAPQREVLGHVAVGGFVTHCGWSSTMEALSCGVPMIAWPIYAEQKMNRVFMVEEMKVAVAVEEGEGGFVAASELEERVRELMDSDVGRDVRNRVEEMKIAAEAAVGENGSSVVALGKFIASVTRDFN